MPYDETRVLQGQTLESFVGFAYRKVFRHPGWAFEAEMTMLIIVECVVKLILYSALAAFSVFADLKGTVVSAIGLSGCAVMLIDVVRILYWKSQC